MKWLLLLLCTSKFISCDEKPKVIVIGAGAAGIAAASKLIENGITDVIILEAEDRYGGRINATKIGEYWADLGAHWVTGDKGNAVYDLASPLDLLSRSQNPGGPEEPKYIQRFYTSAGDQLPQATMDSLENYLTEITSNPKDLDYAKTKTYGAYVESRLNDWFEEHPEVNSTLRDPLTHTLELAQLFTIFADDWYDVSAAEIKMKAADVGYPKINWKNGTYITLLDILMKKYPNPEEELPVLEKTLFNKKVTKINYSENGPVEVVTEDGDKYTADHVIFTPSLGVLKADYAQLFNPPLPEKNDNAIKELGWGHDGVILMYFEEPWWNPEETVINNFVWLESDRKEIENDPQRNWMLAAGFDNFVAYKPKLYELWVCGTYSEEVEKISDELLKNQVVEFLHRFLGDKYNITKPTEIQRSFWSTNKNFRGVSTYPTPQSVANDVTNEDLGQPIVRNEIPIILFAGQATEADTTVNGAISSGWREADRVIKLHSQESKK